MHLRRAWVGEADVYPACNQGPHQAFRTVHNHSPSAFLKAIEDQSFPAHFVKALADIAAIAAPLVTFLTAAFENQALTGSLLAKPCHLWPVSRTDFDFFTRKKMIRAFALLVATVIMLAGAGQAQAQGFFDMRDVMGGGPNFGGGGASPIPRQTVNFASNYAPGTIFIDTAERRLYLVLPNGQALRYGIGVGRDGFRWGGTHRITAKKEWPSWTPPSQMLRRRPDLPRHMSGGIDNPLGARAMYLGSTLYRIHGSNEPETIGQAVSSGCFRMTNDDVTDLYSRVSVGTTVVVKN
jgi:lipoprotein-anchoring transpeptidase ErfK/SrfK